MINYHEKLLSNLFKEWAGAEPDTIDPLPISGSSRKYFRISGNKINVMGAYNISTKENEAFFALTNHFSSIGLNVPELYHIDKSKKYYLQKDLGDVTLYSTIKNSNGEFSQQNINHYKQAIEQLIKFQIEGTNNFDFSVCYPRSEFDHQSILWDLNYCKYFFLKSADIYFDEQKLEDDFNSLIKFLLQADKNYFLYRDFQSRNIMLFEDDLYFIDYQGGRRGALQYDIASLLIDARANIPEKLREELLEFYLQKLSSKIKVGEKEFLKFYSGYMLIRILQAMGAYGYRGLVQKKTHFLQSIPIAIKNLDWLMSTFPIDLNFDELKKVIDKISEQKIFSDFSFTVDNKKLKVTITSFSYKEEIPIDLSGNGGGFVFDCRSITNPGRVDKYKDLTGLDDEVKIFLDNQKEAADFLSNIIEIIDSAVLNYIKRNFEHLMVNFGCTGGQHRSVFCAEALAKHLKNKFDVSVMVNHTQLKKMSA